MFEFKTYFTTIDKMIKPDHKILATQLLIIVIVIVWHYVIVIVIVIVIVVFIVMQY